jgi:hypothetical protein
MEQSQPTQTPRQRRRLDPFLRKPLWVILKEEDCESYPRHHSAGAVDSSTSTFATHSTSSHDGDANTNLAGGLELPRRGGNHEARVEYCDNDEVHHTNPILGTTSSESQPTQVQQQPILGRTHHPHPSRHLTLFDLVSIGVGGTIGSGIFVLNGFIAHSYAGPATFLSWAISGFAALLSGCCYAELSGRIPTAGSSYAYAFVALGELPAFVTACMLSLEFLLSGSAVARWVGVFRYYDD